MARAAKENTMRRHFSVLSSVFREARRNNLNLQRAMMHFGIGLERMTFESWKTLFLQVSNDLCQPESEWTARLLDAFLPGNVL